MFDKLKALFRIGGAKIGMVETLIVSQMIQRLL